MRDRDRQQATSRRVCQIVRRVTGTLGHRSVVRRVGERTRAFGVSLTPPGEPSVMGLRGIVFVLVSALALSSISIAADWPMYGHDTGQSRSNPGELTITTANVASLKQLWVFKTAAPVSATPT